MRLTLFVLLASSAMPAVAQDHSGHTMPAPPPPAQDACEAEAARHRAMGHPVQEGSCAQGEATAAKPTDPDAGRSGMDHSQMDHSQMPAMNPPAMGQAQMQGMDHASPDRGAMQETGPAQMDHEQMAGMGDPQMGHGSMDMGPIPQTPPPDAAGSGPPRAADAIWGSSAMRPSREALRLEQGAQTFFWFQGDRLEYRAREGADGYLWDLQGYYGGDINKFWFKSEGEGSFGEKIESAELQGLWSRAIGPWWDLQAGIRQDLTGPERSHAVIGVQGLSPYRFEVDAAAFLSTKGDLTARIEGELDQRITQRLILQPRAEIALSAQDIPELGIGAGLDRIEAGLRLRYEFAREFAPYLGISQEWRIGSSADYARAAGEDPSVTNYVVGVRFWF